MTDRDRDLVDVDGAADSGYDDSDTYHEDPDAPQGTQATLDAMSKDLRRLTRASLIATVGAALLIGIVEGAVGHGFNVSTGFVLGALLATMNLWVLAGGYFAIVDGRATGPRLVLAAVGSLSLLLGAALWVVLFRQQWSVGFGLGLAVPALGGIVYAVQNPR